MNPKLTSRRFYTLPVLLLGLFIWNCKTDKKQNEKDTEETEKPAVVTVVTKSMEFIAPDTIPSGWNTFVYKNQSTEPHFILLDKYPEGVTIKNTIEEVAPAFEEGMSLIMEGENDAAMEAFRKLPEWFSQVVYSGGTGLISPGETAVSTVHLKPGYYVMECYVRMPDGRFHTSMGMAKPLIITDDSSGVEPPNAQLEMILSSTSGMELNGEPTTGKAVFSVTFEDQVAHENFVGHDVNLVRVDPDADLEALETWINWATPTGLMSSTQPEGFNFLGGVNDAPAGSVLYFETELKPGRYALISEVPNAAQKGLLTTFTVSQ